MKTTYGKLLEAAPALRELTEKDLDVKAAISLSRLMKLCDSELKLFEEQRLRLCRKHGTLSEDKKNYIFSEDSKKKFSEEFSALILSEVNIPQGKISVKPSGFKLKASTILACEDFIKFS